MVSPVLVTGTSCWRMEQDGESRVRGHCPDSFARIAIGSRYANRLLRGKPSIKTFGDCGFKLTFSSFVRFVSQGENVESLFHGRINEILSKMLDVVFEVKVGVYRMHNPVDVVVVGAEALRAACARPPDLVSVPRDILASNPPPTTPRKVSS